MHDAVSDESDLVVGPLVYASVGLDETVVVGLDGIGTYATAMPQRDDLGEAIDVSDVIAINRGADRAAAVEVGGRMIEPETPETARTERLTHDAIRALMKHRVEGREGPLGGGGGGRRRAKPVKISADFHQPDTREPERPPRLQVVGLTTGEALWYQNRRDIALEVIRGHIGAIIRNEVEEPRPVYGVRLSYSFTLFGLLVPEIRIVHKYPRSTRLALARVARERDGDHIARLEHGSSEA